MAQTNSVSLALAGRDPVHTVIAQFPVVCFTLALATDLAYWRTANLMWQNFSAWLLFVGLVFGALAVLAAIIDLFTSRFPYGRSSGWCYGIGSVLVLVLAFFNALIHAGDGWTAIVPWGLALSAVTVVVMIVTAALSRALFSRRRLEAGHHE